jgi:CRP-like cAMP-binding protein
VERLQPAKRRVGLRMIEILGRRLAASEAKLEELAYRTAANRLAATLAPARW